MTSKALAITCFCMLLSAVVVYSMGKKAHNFDNNECTICHLGRSNAISPEAYASLTSKCMTCHTTLYDNGYMHPVDIRPNKARVPLDFPLSPAGTITCATCHDVHTEPETPSGKKSSFLRRHEKGKVFCDICHGNADMFASGHNAVLGEAHSKSKSKFTPGDALGQEIDSLSRNCISCHDGAVGSSVSLNAGSWSHSQDFIKNDNGGMHPIGMKYQDIVMKKKKTALRPIESVDKRIRFFDDGKVGCGSCHDPYSTIPKQLVIEDTESKLCFACHQMDGTRRK